jgi:hypothetical protein
MAKYPSELLILRRRVRLLTNWRVNLGDKSKSAWSLMKVIYTVAQKNRSQVTYRSRVLDDEFSFNRFVIPITTFQFTPYLCQTRMIHVRDFFKIKVRIVDLQLSPISHTFTL